MKLYALIACAALAACQTTAPVATRPSAQQVSAPVPSGTTMALLNVARTEAGRPPVTEDARLSRAARIHAQDMVRNGYFSHTSQNGASFTDRARAAGYACAAAENIAFGQRSEAEVIAEWMTSSGHRRNILLPAAVEYGIGRAGNMWVLMMGRGC